MRQTIVIGFDPRPHEAVGFAVARSSIRRRLTVPMGIFSLSLEALRREGYYRRPTAHRDGRLWDVISDAPMATEFAISRFLVPHLCEIGWALFVDCDVMARVNLARLFEQGDPTKACMVVKHDYTPKADTKMDGQAQQPYPRKNWSSVVLWNCGHPGTKALTPEVVNRERGLWLHQFQWLDDNEIGELDPCWNHLVGDVEHDDHAKLVHFTNGLPNMRGYEGCAFAEEWRRELQAWAA